MKKKPCLYNKMEFKSFRNTITEFLSYIMVAVTRDVVEEERETVEKLKDSNYQIPLDNYPYLTNTRTASY